MTDYQRRVVDDELDQLLPDLAAIAIEGPKAVGKTATAERRARTIRRLDVPDQLAVAQADPSRLLDGGPPILIDEWQLLPASWDAVRRAVDAGADPGSFLLTGSASPDGRGSHSGAARIVAVRMRPLSLAERELAEPSVSLGELLTGARPALRGESPVTLEQYVDEILRSGFPGLRHLTGRALRSQLDGYVQRIIDRDFADLGRTVRDPGGLRRWMRAYAAAVSTTTSYEKIRDAATSNEGTKPAKTTTGPFREILERLWILDPVDAWVPQRNQLKELASAHKHQLADPALAGILLGLTQRGLLEGRSEGPVIPRDGTQLGALFESLVTLSVRTYAQACEATVKHFRTHRGEREVDLIVERNDGRIVAIESKLTQTPGDEDVKHLKWLRERAGDDVLDAIVITTGTAAYRREDGIGVVPAALLGA